MAAFGVLKKLAIAASSFDLNKKAANDLSLHAGIMIGLFISIYLLFYPAAPGQWACGFILAKRQTVKVFAPNTNSSNFVIARLP